MARISASLAVANTRFGSYAFSNIGHVVDVHNGPTFATDKTAFETALATLVADGASPTQAHVTAANNAYTTFKADLAPPAPYSDVIISVDTVKTPTVSVLRAAVEKLMLAFSGSNYLTP